VKKKIRRHPLWCLPPNSAHRFAADAGETAIEIIGAIDTYPAKVRRDLGEIVPAPKTRLGGSGFSR